jgi:TonB family protein
MRTGTTIVTAATIAGILSLAGPIAFAQASAPRKVSERIAPRYPELAKRMHIEGAVKVEVAVRPNGSVKSTTVLGGSPVLVQAALDAVQKWKFEASPNETTEIVVLNFAGQ